MAANTYKDTGGKIVRVLSDGTEFMQVSTWIQRDCYFRLEKKLGKVKGPDGLPCVNMAALCRAILELHSKTANKPKSLPLADRCK